MGGAYESGNGFNVVVVYIDLLCLKLKLVLKIKKGGFM